MATTRTYLDHNASAPLRPAARAAMIAALEQTGNPSSVHGEGRQARALVEGARDAVAALIGGRARDVVFTSGASEANTLLLSPGLRRSGDRRDRSRLMICAAEHASVLRGHRFETADILPLRSDGQIDADAAREAIAAHHEAQPDVRLVVAVQAANSETGVVQPVAALAETVHAVDGLLVCDAVQAVGKVPLSLAELGADAITVSAHKLGGPKGAGAAVLTSGLDVAALIGGGGQELGRRSGTENVPAIAGFGAAANELADGLKDEPARLRHLRDGLEERLSARLSELVVFGRSAPRLPNTSLIAAPGLKAETLLMALDLAGFAVSSGSACSSGKVRRSHVLEAMGVGSDLAEGAVRISFGWTSGPADATRFADAFEKTIETLYERRARAA